MERKGERAPHRCARLISTSCRCLMDAVCQTRLSDSGEQQSCLCLRTLFIAPHPLVALLLVVLLFPLRFALRRAFTSIVMFTDSDSGLSNPTFWFDATCNQNLLRFAEQVLGFDPLLLTNVSEPLEPVLTPLTTAFAPSEISEKRPLSISKSHTVSTT